MVTREITWEEQTNARLREAQNKLKQAQDTIEEAKVEVEYWEQYTKALENVLTLTKKHGVVAPNGHKSLNVEHLLNQSTWDNLKIIMEANKGILRVIDAVAFLVGIKMFNDREHARNVIYSTLYSHKQDVQRIRKGIYSLRDPNEKIGKPIKKKGMSRTERTILEKAIFELKATNPDMTKDDITQTLVKRGFNFMGQSPGRTVHGFLLSLAKKAGKAQLTLIEPK